ncbi:hypothetical protein T459_12107 [Capsicum annuum]|uniref:Uncharacterized protein n=1 Tax=Capsicum annuum TaxID=4072 RepID=A0A2G2ZP01_CAPAN|nr:hypothetical protein T459_12107 [Capsicum annuum]
MPSAVGYQSTLSTELRSLQERITSVKEGSITSIQVIYVPADDLTDPAPAIIFAYLDATTVLLRGLTAKGSLTIVVAHHMYFIPPYPYLATNYGTQLSLFTHHIWIGGFLIVGAAAHATIFMVRDFDPTTRYNDLLDRVFRHRDTIISHLNWACIFLGFHNFGLYIHYDTIRALGHPQDIISDTAIQLQPIFSQWIQKTHDLAPGATALGATASTSLTWGRGDLVAVGGKVSLFESCIENISSLVGRDGYYSLVNDPLDVAKVLPDVVSCGPGYVVHYFTLIMTGVGCVVLYKVDHSSIPNPSLFCPLIDYEALFKPEYQVPGFQVIKFLERVSGTQLKSVNQAMSNEPLCELAILASGPLLKAVGLGIMVSFVLVAGRLKMIELLANLLAIVVSNIYPIPACPTAHAVPNLVLDMALSKVAKDSKDSSILSSEIIDTLYFFLSIPVRQSCSSYGSYIEKECEIPYASSKTRELSILGTIEGHNKLPSKGAPVLHLFLPLLPFAA